MDVFKGTICNKKETIDGNMIVNVPSRTIDIVHVDENLWK